jgi:hypothetical protein
MLVGVRVLIKILKSYFSFSLQYSLVVICIVYILFFSEHWIY